MKDELSEDINNCISSRTERDTDPEKNITIKEEQECIIIDETVIKAENSMEGDVQSIRLVYIIITHLDFSFIKDFPVLFLVKLRIP